jgi:hypothetical protein
MKLSRKHNCSFGPSVEPSSGTPRAAHQAQLNMCARYARTQSICARACAVQLAARGHFVAARAWPSGPAPQWLARQNQAKPSLRTPAKMVQRQESRSPAPRPQPGPGPGFRFRAVFPHTS